VDLKQTRRRGPELETAILDAAWDQLTHAGYGEFTFEAIAARAGTSRTVLYRRWSDRAELLRATIRHAGAFSPLELPDTGTLRDDVVTVLRRMSTARAGLVATLSVQLGEYFRETGTSLSDLREVMGRRGRSGMQLLLDRAEARGEVDLSGVSQRVIELPLSLVRHDLLMNLAGVSDAVIDEIVDDVWLPLLRAKGAMRG